MDGLRCMTLIDSQLPMMEDILVDTQRNPLPPPVKAWTSTVAYADVSLVHPDRDMRVTTITAEVRPEG